MKLIGLVPALVLLTLIIYGANGSVKAESNTDQILEASVARDPLARDTFSFPEPSNNDWAKKITLWATYYYLPQITDGGGNYPLRDMQGQELGPRVSLREWCDSAMEGSVRISFKNGEAKTFNYAGVTTSDRVDCSSIFRHDVSRTKFREAIGPYGDGIESYILAPYRTLATDAEVIKPGTVVYIPEARGALITLANGKVLTHDGYFFAGDKGGAIKGNHVDVYIGTHKKAPFFPWIKSNESKTFNALVITDKKIIAEMYDLHSAK